jgi:hypothetical protein
LQQQQQEQRVWNTVGFFRRYYEHGSCDGMFRLMQAFSAVKM